MCRFVTIIGPSACREQVKTVLEERRGYSSETHNQHISKALPGSVQFVSPSAGCDCSTVLDNSWVEHLADFDHEKTIEKWRRQGWSEAKIERAIADKEAGRATTTHKAPSDSFELWAAILDDLLTRCTNHGPVAVLVHDYSGALDEAKLNLVRKRVSANESIMDALRSLKSDELVFFDEKWWRARKLMEAAE